MSAAPQRRMCPGCDSAMQAYFASGVEVDRCNFCGGFWLDGGELEGLLGHAVEFESLGGTSRRKCVGCRVPLHGVSVQGVPVEACDGCHGVYLDDGELEALAREQVRLSPTASGSESTPDRERERERERVTFRCAGCGAEKELGEGMATARGLACPVCFTGLDERPNPITPGRWGHRRGLGFDEHHTPPVFTGLDDVVSFITRLFR